MIDGKTENPAPVGVAVCVEQIGPVWLLGGETHGCVLPAEHLGDPTSDHECSCGAWWTRHSRPTAESTDMRPYLRTEESA